MPSELAELHDQLRAMADVLRRDVEQVAAAQQTVARLRDEAVQVSSGSSHPAGRRLPTLFTEAAGALRPLPSIVESAAQLIDEYIAQTGDATSHGSTTEGVTERATHDASLPRGERGEALAVRMADADLTADQSSSLKRFSRKLPARAEAATITGMPDGRCQFEARVTGRVPGSYAVYTKTVDEDGVTVSYTKTTVLPDGSIAHVKDKMHR